MSKATKRKHVTKEVLDEFVLPDDKKEIVRVMSSKGNNLHEVQTAKGEHYLVSMPTKFRKNVWIKRGDFVMVEPIAEGDKVKAEITHILYKEQVKYIREEGKWPAEFGEIEKNKQEEMIPIDMLPPSDSESDSDNSGGLTISNPNRPLIKYDESDEESSEEDDDFFERKGESDTELDEKHFEG